ncbi:DUF4158 domain-containing protein [Escherichia coli]|nr:DUF4158 domain-containing protein [Escherichia coli]MDT8523380.1 DUF4158 domain-containing protein [Escherichia coli]
MSFLDSKSYDTLFGLPELYEDALPRFSLSCEDIAFARTHRRSHNRLGFAIQLALVRDLGRTLRAGEIPRRLLSPLLRNNWILTLLFLHFTHNVRKPAGNMPAK